MSWLSEWLARMRGPQAPASAAPGGTDLASKIVRAMMRRKFRVDTLPGQLNIAYVAGMDPDGKPNSNAPDKWNDLRCVIGFDGLRPVMRGLWVATTEPGFYYGRDHIIGRDSNGNVAAAHVEFGQYFAWQDGFHRNDPSRPALVQTGGAVTVWRDSNRNMIHDPGDPDEAGWYGINQHDGQDGSPETIGAHSAGCLVVRSRAQHAEFVKLYRTDPRFIANRKYVFGTAILPASEIV